MTKKSFLTGVYIFFLSLAFVSCDKDDDSTAVNQTFDSFLSTGGNFTIFKAAMDKAGLDAFKNGAGPFTWVIPTDAAFQAAAIDLDSVNRMTAGQANYLLMYHLINANLTTQDMDAQNSFPRASQLGATGNLFIGKFNNKFYINGGTLNSVDNLISNGVIHVSDRAFTPPNLRGNLQKVLTTTGEHTIFIAALTRANRWTVVGSASVFTIFAPTDAAMTAAGFTTASIATTPVATVDSLVRYHMLSGTRVFTNDIGNRTSPGTFLGTTFTFTGSADGTKVKGKNNPTAFDITKPDLLGINGVVHVINGVMKY